ncbi:Hypothetical protein A7982_02854 [Minicystis rosea]|nr:Hypothetical protein A7982_02854 [Minicystis rosea]
MNTKMILAVLASLALSACAAGDVDESSSEGAEEVNTGEAASALLGIEHLFNRDLSLPAGQSLATYQVPSFYDGGSNPFSLSLPNNVLFWHANLSVPGNAPNPGTLSSYVRFVTDAPGATSAALLSVSPGATSSLVQAFASYPGGTPVTGPSRITARVFLLSGDVTFQITNVNGYTACSVSSDASTPRGVWTTLATDCAAPPANDPSWMVVLGTKSDTGTIALVDYLSVRE